MYSRSGQPLFFPPADPFPWPKLDASIATSFAAGLANTWLSNLVAPISRAGSYNAEQARPNLMPAPEAIFQAWRRGLISDDVAADALSSQGIMPVITASVSAQHVQDIGAGLNVPTKRWYSQLWDRVSLLSMSRPDLATLQSLALQGRISAADYDWTSRNLWADREAWRIVNQAGYQMPALDTLLYWRRLGIRYGGLSEGMYREAARKIGWWDDAARDLAERQSNIPGIADLYAWYWRAADDHEREEKWSAYLRASGWTDPRAVEMMMRAMRPMPGFGDLVSLAVREVWDEGVVRRWGYDAEFPYPLQYWGEQQGWNWGRATVGPDGTRYPSVPWPKAHWRAHWRPMALDHAYRAFQRFRPERMYRYRDRFPNIQPFTAQLLNDVIKVADYPVATRDWLAALAQPVMPIMGVRQLYRYGLRNREWARQQLLDRGYVGEDADAMLDLLGADEQIQVQRSYRTTQIAVARETVTELRRAYRMGAIDQAALAARLHGLGFPATFPARVAALEDARAARENLTVFIRGVRRSYLTGALSDQEVALSLSAARIAPAAQARYLRLWQSELGVERRSLSTQQIVAAVAAGALLPAVAAVRLGRLGWTAPDAALLLQEAVAKLTRAQAAAAARATSVAQRQARQLQAAQRQAQAAARSAQSQLRRIYPIATLRRQYCQGIRKAPTIRALLLSQGYSTDAIDALLLQWARECEASPPAPDKRVGSLESYYRRQTPVGNLKAWWQRGIITDSWARQRLAKLGFEPGAVEATVRLWASSVGKKSGPAKEGTPPPAPLS